MGEAFPLIGWAHLGFEKASYNMVSRAWFPSDAMAACFKNFKIFVTLLMFLLSVLTDMILKHYKAADRQRRVNTGASRIIDVAYYIM